MLDPSRTSKSDAHFSDRLLFDHWTARAQQHKLAVLAYTQPCRDRRARRKSHPVLDFLFTYYSFSMGRLEAWHPPLNVALECSNFTDLPTYYSEQYYSQSNGCVFLDLTKLNEERRSSMRWMSHLLTQTQQRSPNYACYGMHEWAMVYGGSDVRHRESAPLRLGQDGTDEVVRSRPILCSHYDAFRFFQPDARSFNRLYPEKEKRDQHEQPGCVHANMDIYKWAYKCMPWVGSDFLWKTFLLALEMRELDMRASPYDLSDYGYTPIKIETSEGRKIYEQEQRRLAEKAKPLRQQLIEKLNELLDTSEAFKKQN